MLLNKYRKNFYKYFLIFLKSYYAYNPNLNKDKFVIKFNRDNKNRASINKYYNNQYI